MNLSLKAPPWYLRPFFYLRWRMAISFGVLFAVTLAATHVVRTFGIPFTPYQGWYGDQRAQVLKELGFIADLNKERLLLWFEERKNDALMLCHNGAVSASLPVLQSAVKSGIETGLSGHALESALKSDLSYLAALDRLQGFMDIHGAYQSIFLAESHDGLVLVSTESHHVGQRTLSCAAIEKVPDGSRDVTLNLDRGTLSDWPRLFIACGIGSGLRTLDETPQRTAIGVLTIDPTSLGASLVRSGSDLGQTGEILLVDRKARPIMPLKKPLSPPGEGRSRDVPLTSDVASRVSIGQEGIMEGLDDRGVPVMAAYRSLPLTPEHRWGLIVKIDRAEVFENLWKRVIYSGIVGVVCGLLSAGALAFLLARIISRPVEDLRRTVQQIQSGNMAARSAVVTSNEVGMLTLAFNAMISRVENWQRDLEREVRIRTLELKSEITQRKRAEEALARERELLSITLRSMGDGVISTDAQGKVLSFNECAEELTGWTETEALGRSLGTVFNIFREDTKQPSGTLVQQVLATGSPAGLSNHTALLSRDGIERFIASTAAPIRDHDGAVVGTVLVFRDVTENKRTLEALQLSEARFRQIYDDAPVMMHSMDSCGVIRNVNNQWLTALGYTREEVLNRSLASFLTPQSAELLSTSLDIVWRDKAMREVRHQYVTKAGDIREIREDLVLISDPALGNMSLSTLRDVTHEMSLQKQLLRAQKMEAIGTLTGGIAHDFNNLLQIIGGWAEVGLIEVGEDQPGHAALNQIAEAALSAAELTQGLLMFSRKVEGKLTSVDLNKVLEQTAKMLSRTIPKMITTELDLADGLHRIYADPALVQQVVMNLALNARDAMPEGGNLVIQTRNTVLESDFCQAHIDAVPGEYVLLSVADSGCGMTSEALEHIFDPFYTTKEPGKGTGLGLSIVYGIVKSHGGLVQCYSEPGKGTTFRIYLPVASKDQLRQETNTDMVLIGGTETVLLVDDDDAIRELGKTILEMFGYTVRTAAGGAECVDIYEREWQGIDLIILDLIMPRMSGKTCLLKIHMVNPEARVIICSGYASEWQLEETIRGHAKAWLTKPYHAHDMLATVRKVLDHKAF